jgi:rubrerythrin
LTENVNTYKIKTKNNYARGTAMANLKESFTKGITAINVKTNNFMEESKCKTYISTLENEIKGLKQSIGDRAYENWLKDENNMEGLEELFQKIKEKYQEIEEQKGRMEQLSQEERQILGSNNSQAMPNNAKVVFCSQCGTPNADNYKFCSKCGAPMK